MKPAGWRKIVLVALAVALATAFFGLGLHKHLTLENLKASREAFQAAYSQNPLLFLGAYFCLYVVSVSFQLPGATVLTLAGGAFFGLWTGTLLVSFASTIGATLACFMARYLLRDWVQARFGDRLARVNEGIAREGAFYLFSLRLIPVIPFFLVNLLMGLTSMPLKTFYWVSQLGMLPGTIVFVNAGSQLAKVESVSSILSPGLVLSLALLGVFPLAVKKLVALTASRRKRHG